MKYSLPDQKKWKPFTQKGHLHEKRLIETILSTKKLKTVLVINSFLSFKKKF